MAATYIYSDQQILDDSGDPIVGAKLESYAAGTSTALATYSDDALTSANANPASGATTGNQVTDADGRLGNIYLAISSYKFILKDSAGVTLWTHDNYEGSPDGAAKIVTSVDTIVALKALTVALNDLVNVEGHTTAGDGGGGFFRYNSGSSATDDNGITIAPDAGSGRWIRQFAGSVHTDWFGLVGDGTTNDSTAMQSAATAATGKELIINNCATSYAIKGVAIPADTDVRFEGGALLYPSDTSEGVNSANVLMTVTSGCRIYGWRSSGVGYDTETGSYSNFAKDLADNPPGTYQLYEALNSSGAQVVPVRHCTVIDGSTDVYFEDMEITNGCLGLWSSNPDGLTVRGFKSYNQILWPLTLSAGYKNVSLSGLNMERIWAGEAVKFGSNDGTLPNGRNENIVIDGFNIRDWVKSKDFAGKDGIDMFMDAGKNIHVSDGVMEGPGGFEIKPTGNNLSATELYFEDITLADIRIRVIENDGGNISGGVRLHWASSGQKRVQDQFRNVRVTNVECNYVGTTADLGAGFWVGLVDNVTMDGCRSTGFGIGLQIGEDLPAITTIDSTDVFSDDAMLSATGDGATTVYNLTFMVPTASFAVFVNGTKQTEGAGNDYTVNEATKVLTFTAGSIPPNTHPILVYQLDGISGASKVIGFKTVDCMFEGTVSGVIGQPNCTIQGWEATDGHYDGGDYGLHGITQGMIFDQCVFNGTRFTGGGDQASDSHAAVGGAQVFTNCDFINCAFEGKNLYAMYLQGGSGDTSNECIECFFDLTGGGVADQAMRTNTSNTGWTISGGYCRGVLEDATYGAVREASTGDISVTNFRRTKRTALTAGPSWVGTRGEIVPSSLDDYFDWICPKAGVNWVNSGSNPTYEGLSLLHATQAALTLRGASINDSFALKANIADNSSQQSNATDFITHYMDVDTIHYRANSGSGTVVSKTVNGLELASGKVLKVNSVTVVGTQQTTGVAEGTFVENSGGAVVNVDSTVDGYTMQQVVKALRVHGLLA